MKLERQELQNPIRVNHRGFLRNSQKRFILTENKTESMDFRVVLIDNVKWITVFEGKMTPVIEDGHTYYVGDFTNITQDGDYQIEAGGFTSRQFVIYDGAYDICKRVLLEYYKYQRCGHPLGWNGSCHLDDGFIKETGERVDLSGGYHQSCDLRKSPGGLSIGIYAMLKCAIREKSEWSKILLKDEAEWACDYLYKTIQENGAMYNTLNAPFGWGAREFYKSPAPSSAQWNTTSALALGSLYLKDKNEEKSKKYLEKAILSWNYMMSDARPSDTYRHPDKYPMGMDPDFFYDQCRKNSSADLAYQITCSSELYRATGDEKYLRIIENVTPKLLSYVAGGEMSHELVRDDDKTRLVTGSCSYCWQMGNLFALCDAYELLGARFGLKEIIEKALASSAALIDKSIWKCVRHPYSDGDLDIVDGHEGKTRRQGMRTLEAVSQYDGIICYSQSEQHLEPGYSTHIAIFMARCARLLGKSEYLKYSQFVVDTVLGVNALDSSHIHAIGYNHAPHDAFGQFFPSTPFIPGAVGVDYSSIDTTKGAFSEFDMPCVGMTMYLISELEGER